MKRLTRMLAYAALVAVPAALAQNQSVDLFFQPALVSAAATPEKVFLPWTDFNVAFDRDANALFVDQFNPLRLMDANVTLANLDFDHWHDHVNRSVRATFSKAVVFGLRDATGNSPLLKWLQEQDGFLGRLVRDSVDSTEEEAVSPVNASYNSVERSWWNRLGQSGDLHFGIRPLRTDPYAFASLAVKDGDTVYFMGNLRYHYSHFSDHSVELAFSVPLPDGISLDVGAAYQLAGRDDVQKVVLKIFKSFSNGLLMHLGMEVRDRPGLIAGVTLPL